MKTFFLKVIASDKVFYSGKTEVVVLPAPGGEKAVLSHHENMVVSIEPGELRIRKEDGATIKAIVGVGFAQIINNRVTILVDTAEYPEDIDERRAKEALERAEEQLRQRQSSIEYYHSRASLSRAMARLKITSKYN